MDTYELLLSLEKLRPIQYVNHFRANPDHKKYVISLTSFLPDDVPITQRCWHILNSVFELALCPVCYNDYAKFKEMEHRVDGKRVYSYKGYSTCSAECTRRLNAYKVSKAVNTDSFKNKKSATNLEKYGHEDHMKSDSIRKKVSDIQREIHKSERGKEIMDRVKATNMKRYGHEFASQSKAVKEKSMMTLIAKHGVDHVRKSEEVNTKRMLTNLERYGHKEYQLSEEFKRKMSEYSDIDYASLGYEIINYTSLQFKKYRHLSCGKLFNMKDARFRRIYQRDQQPCPHCNHDPKFMNSSQGEKEMAEFIESLGYKIETNYKFGKNQEVDVFIPDLNIAIDYNGLYWHCELFKEKNFHKDKSIMVKRDLGAELFYIWEDEWLEQRRKIKNYLRSLLGRFESTHYARKCTIRELAVETERPFLNEHHLQDYVSSTVCYGLYHQNELVSLMSFIKIMDKWQIQRYVSKSGTRVIGGFSKLFTHFMNSHKPDLVESFVDSSKFRGESYNSLKKHDVVTQWQPVGYHYVKSGKKFNRRRFMKHKLADIPNFEFESALTEHQNCANNGFNRIYDSGQIKVIISSNLN